MAGRNSDGQLGLDIEPSIATPVRLNYLPKITFIGCGVSSHHSCKIEYCLIDAIDTKGNMYTCGQAEYNQLGHNSDENITRFKQVPLKSRKACYVAGGSQFTIALLTKSPKKSSFKVTLFTI